MEVLSAIQTRRSIRKFKGDLVSDDLIKKVLKAGMDAPSADNLQRRKFFILSGEAKKNFKVTMSGISPESPVPIIIVVCAEMKMIEKWGEERSEFYAHMDCAASIMNILTAAHALGLGACWVGTFDKAKTIELLKLPENLKPIALIPLGYANEKPNVKDRKRMEDACEFLNILPLQETVRKIPI